MRRGSLIASAAFALLASGAVSAQHHGAPPPVPLAGQAAKPTPASGYVIERIGDGLHVVTANGYMILVMVGPKGVAVIDAPPAMGDAPRRAIAEITSRPVTHLVYSHGHGDHIGAAGAYGPSVRIVAHAETARQLARGGPCTDCAPIPDPRPRPHIVFDDSYRLDLGDGQVLELAYHGPNHQPGNIFVYAPKQSALMVVDVVYPGWVPFDLLAISTDIPGWLKAYDEILRYDFRTFVGGHLTRLGTRADVELGRRYVADLAVVAEEVLRATPRGEFIGELGAQTGFENPWWLIERHAEAVTARCAERMVTSYKGRLAGVEVYAQSHCRRMQYSIRVD